MKKQPHEVRHSGWRQEVFARARRLQNALPLAAAAAAAAAGQAAGEAAAAAAAAATAAKAAIDVAEAAVDAVKAAKAAAKAAKAGEAARVAAEAAAAACAKYPLFVAREAAWGWVGPFRWWNGTLEERAWLTLHDAEVALLRVLDKQAAIDWWRCAVGRIRPQVGVPPGEPVTPWSPKNAAQAADSLRSYYDWSDRLFEETRALRNRLIILTAVGVATTSLLLSAGIAGWLKITSGGKPIVAGTEHFLLVALFGTIGAFITGLPVLSAAIRSLPQYTTIRYQLALKLATGPVFALVGVLTLASRFIVNVAPFKNFSGTVLLWAVIFGGTQQLLTGLLDRKAAVLTVEHEARWWGTGA
jgi:hypothetical protein